MAFGLGESVGTAYVRILADGTGLDKSIRDEVEDAVDGAHLDHAGRRAGRDLGDGVAEGFGDEITKGPGWKKAVRNMELSIERNARLDKYFGSPNWKKFVKEAEKNFGDLGFLAAKDMEREFRESGSLEGIEKQQEQMVKRINKIRIDSARQLEREEARRIAARKADVEAAIRDAERLRRAAQKNDTTVRSFADHMDLFGDRMRKAFGGGSRNDFLNFFGGFVSIVPEAIARLARLTQGVQKFGGIFMEAFKGAEGGGGGLAGFTRGLSAMSKAAGPALSAGIAGVAAAIIALEVASSTASLAVGGLTAIIGTLGSGLIGGITLLSASLVPLAAGIGSVVIAWKSLGDAGQAAFNRGVKPLTDAFEGLGDIAAQNIFSGLGEKLAELTPFMQSLSGVTDAVTKSVRDQIDSWVDLANSGAFDRFFEVVGRDMPGQIASLNGVIQNLARSFAGLFAGISPVLSEFLDDLDKVTDKFADWANSAKGNKSITDFFDSALDSVRAIGKALVSAGKLLGNFFRVGAEGGGNELFESLANTFEDWNQSLIENQDEIKKWVQDGADFVRVLGDIVVGITKLVAALDTPFMRTVILATLNSIAFGFKAIAASIELAWKATTNFIAPITEGLNNLLHPIESAKSLFGDLGNKLGITDDKAEKVATAVGHTKEEIARANVIMASAGRRVAAYNDAVARATEKIRNMRKAARQQAESFIDIGKAADRAKGNLSKFTQFLNNQARALEKYAENLRKAGENGVKKGLLADLKDLGPEGARIVAQLANATDREVGKANKAWQRGQDAIDGYVKKQVPEKEILVNNDKALQKIRETENALVGIPDQTVYVDVVPRGQGGVGAASRNAAGGIHFGPTRSITGEAGPEAIVPLRRPLGMVDKSVRALSAFAQGIPFGTNTQGGTGKTLNIGPITVNTPTTDPRAVAVETVNRLALVGGF